jgi:hypothetical protein
MVLKEAAKAKPMSVQEMTKKVYHLTEEEVADLYGIMVDSKTPGSKPPGEEGEEEVK